MLLGLVLKALGWRLKLIFNSAGQRRKSRYTHFLIERMDAVTATSETSASFVEPARDCHPSRRRSRTLPAARGPAGRLLRRPACRASTASGRSAGCAGRRAATCSSRRCAGFCRNTRTSPPSSSVTSRSTTWPLVEKLKQRIAAAGLGERIRFLGELPIEEVPLWYQRISIYVFASRVEGFGLTMLEAMAAGDAVVATRAGAAETVIADGDTGVLAPIDDVEALVAAIEPLMRDPERIAPMGARARTGSNGASAATARSTRSSASIGGSGSPRPPSARCDRLRPPPLSSSKPECSCIGD